MSVNYEDLENWASRVAQELQDICDEAQVSAGKPHDEDECMDLRVLIKELDMILSGEPSWQLMYAGTDTDATDNILLNNG